MDLANSANCADVRLFFPLGMVRSLPETNYTSGNLVKTEELASENHGRLGPPLH
jgi:hypothetical protein